MALIRLAITSAILCGIAAPLAHAADLADFSEARWSGLYAGVRVGVGANSLEWQRYSGPDLTPYAKLGKATGNAGLLGGFNWQIDRTVVGIELGADWLNSEVRETDQDKAAFHNEWMFNFSGRAGYLVTPNTLFYGKAGWALIETKAPADYWSESSDSHWLNGIQAGIGLESKLSDHVTLRAEASYTTALERLMIDDDFYSAKPSFLAAQLALTYQFGNQAKAAATAPAFAKMTDWTGFYAGVHGGGSAAGSVLYDYFVDGEDGPFSEIGASVGASVGYDWQVAPRIVVGLEGSADWLNIKNTELGETTDFVSYDWMAAVTARAGYLIDPATLAYAKAGWAVIDTKTNRDYFFDDARSATLNGIQVGAGIETRLTSNVSLKVEGLYTEATEKLWLNFGDIPDVNYIKPAIVTGNVGLAARF